MEENYELSAESPAPRPPVSHPGGRTQSAPPLSKSASAKRVEPRRGFIAKFTAIVAGAIATLTPLAAGLAVLIDPLRRKASAENWIPVTAYDALPDDGVPYRFPVISDRTDAWTLHAQQPIGAVYLRRQGDAVTAFSAICPHAGCFVDFKPASDIYQCPCHTSGFKIDGAVAFGPSPRALDTLSTRTRDKDGIKVIDVDYRNFVSGKEAKIAQP